MTTQDSIPDMPEQELPPGDAQTCHADKRMRAWACAFPGTPVHGYYGAVAACADTLEGALDALHAALLDRAPYIDGVVNLELAVDPWAETWTATGCAVELA